MLIAGVFIKLPSWPIHGDISKITVKYSDGDYSEEFTLTESEEINNLKHACGTIWFSPLVLNSWEGHNPSWMIDILRPNGRTEHVYVDEDEFGSSGRPNKKILAYLKQNYS